MKKNKILFILVFVICLMSGINSVEADCYEHCLDGSKDNCSYVTECTVTRRVSCNSVEDSFCSKIEKVSCGNVTGIPKKIPELTSYAVTIIQIAIPIILVIMGSIDLFKGITAGKEDEMKKGQQMFIKRLIVGASIFFIVVIVKLLISIVADSSASDIVSCIDCFVDNDCD